MQERAGLLGAPMVDLMSLAPDADPAPDGQAPPKKQKTDGAAGIVESTGLADATVPTASPSGKHKTHHLLPEGASLTILLAPGVLVHEGEDVPPGTQAATPQWTEAQVKKRSRAKPKDAFRIIASEEASDATAATAAATSGRRAYHLLSFGSDSAAWFDLTSWQFHVQPHQPSGKGTELSEPPDRVVMALQATAARAAAESDTSAVASSSQQGAAGARPVLFKKAQQLAWLRQMRDANGPEAICQVVVDAAEQLDPVNLATALHRLAKCAPFASYDPFTEHAWEGVAVCIKAVLQDGLKRYSSQACANIAWALMVFEGIPKRGAERQDGSLPATIAPDASALMRLALIRACEDMTWAASAAWDSVAEWCEDWTKDGLWGGFKSSEISSLCQVCARTRLVAPVVSSRVMTLLAQGVAICRWRDFGTQEMATMTSGFQAAGLLPPGVFELTAKKAIKNWSWFSPQEASMVLSVVANRSGKVNVATLSKFVSVVTQAAMKDELATCNAVDLANFMWSVGKLRDAFFNDREKYDEFIRRASEFTSLLSVRVMESLNISWRPLELVLVLSGMLECQAANPKLLEMVCSRWRAWLGDSTEGKAGAGEPECLAPLVRSVSLLGFAEPLLMLMACSRLDETLSGDVANSKWTAQDVCMVLWAAACTVALVVGAPGEREPCLNASSILLMDSDDVTRLATLTGRLLLRTWEMRRAIRGWERRHVSTCYNVHCVLWAFTSAKSGSGVHDQSSAFTWEPPAKALQSWKGAFASNHQHKSADELWQQTSSSHKVIYHELTHAVIPKLCSEMPTIQNEADMEGWFVDIVVSPLTGTAPPIAIEVDGPSHFVQLLDEKGVVEERLDGQSHMKRWFLRQVCGAVPVSVSTRLVEDTARLRKDLGDKIMAALEPKKKKQKKPTSVLGGEAPIVAEPEPHAGVDEAAVEAALKTKTKRDRNAEAVDRENLEEAAPRKKTRGEAFNSEAAVEEGGLEEAAPGAKKSRRKRALEAAADEEDFVETGQKKKRGKTREPP